MKLYIDKVDKFITSNAKNNHILIVKKQQKCSAPGESLGIFANDESVSLVSNHPEYSAACNKAAMKKEEANKGSCKFFMYSTYWFS